MKCAALRVLTRYVLLIAAGAVIAAVLGSCSDVRRAENSSEPEKVVVAYAPFDQATLLWIADDRGFFHDSGLAVTLRKYDTGAGSLDGTLDGEADVTIGVTEFPTVGRVLKKKRIRLLASSAKSNQIYIVARKDRGIKTASDLKGKRVGTTVGTIAEFYLGRFLNLRGMGMRDVSLVDVTTPIEWTNAVARGDIDAIATAQPHVNSAKERLGSNAVVWPAQGGQNIFGLIVSTDRWVVRHRQAVDKLLNALVRAEHYLANNPAEARAIVRKRLGVDAAYIDDIWSKNQYSVTLDQSLILAMEDEARWMIDNNLTTETQVPDFLGYSHTAALKTIKPESVNLR